MWPQWEWCNVGLYHGHNYEDCVWIMHSKYDVNFTVTIKDNQLDAAQTLLLVGSGIVNGMNRIFNGPDGKDRELVFCEDKYDLDTDATIQMFAY